MRRHERSFSFRVFEDKPKLKFMIAKRGPPRGAIIKSLIKQNTKTVIFSHMSYSNTCACLLLHPQQPFLSLVCFCENETCGFGWLQQQNKHRQLLIISEKWRNTVRPLSEHCGGYEKKFFSLQALSSCKIANKNANPARDCTLNNKSSLRRDLFLNNILNISLLLLLSSRFWVLQIFLLRCGGDQIH